jgi:hypothetical protein
MLSMLFFFFFGRIPYRCIVVWNPLPYFILFIYSNRIDLSTLSFMAAVLCLWTFPEHAILSRLWSTVHLLSEEPIASNGEATEAYLIRPPFGLFWIQGICGFDCTNQTAWQKTWLWVDSISWIVCFFFGGRPGECSLLGWCMDWHGGRWSWWCLDLRWAQFDWAPCRFA